MKKVVLALLTALVLSSCLTVSRIERNCDKFAQVCVTEKETVTVFRDTTIYRTDTIKVPLPVRDTVRITDTVRIINNKAFLKPISKKIGIIGVDAWVDNSILGVQAYLTDSTILHEKKDTIILKKTIRERATRQTVKEKYIPGIYRAALSIILIQLAILAAWLLRKKYGK